MVARKTLKDKKKEKPESDAPKAKKVNYKWNLDALPDAVQDEKFIGSVGDELVVVRLRDGRMQKSLCTVTSIESENVHTFDETRGQWFVFSPVGLDKYGIVVKKSLKEKKVSDTSRESP
jgi:hypothetical protein